MLTVPNGQWSLTDPKQWTSGFLSAYFWQMASIAKRQTPGLTLPHLQSHSFSLRSDFHLVIQLNRFSGSSLQSFIVRVLYNHLGSCDTGSRVIARVLGCRVQTSHCFQNITCDLQCWSKIALTAVTLYKIVIIVCFAANVKLYQALATRSTLSLGQGVANFNGTHDVGFLVRLKTF